MLGHKLEMTVTAEGIETAHQAEILAALACDHMQGFLYGRPTPASEIALFLLENTRTRLIPKEGAEKSERQPAVASSLTRYQVERLTSSKSQSRKARTLGRWEVCAGYAT